MTKLLLKQIRNQAKAYFYRRKVNIYDAKINTLLKRMNDDVFSWKMKRRDAKINYLKLQYDEIATIGDELIYGYKWLADNSEIEELITKHVGSLFQLDLDEAKTNQHQIMSVTSLYFLWFKTWVNHKKSMKRIRRDCKGSANRESFAEIKPALVRNFKMSRDAIKSCIKLSFDIPLQSDFDNAYWDYVVRSLKYKVIDDMVAPFKRKRKKLQNDGFKNVAKLAAVFGAELAVPIVSFFNLFRGLVESLNIEKNARKVFDTVNEELYCLEQEKNDLLLTAYIAVLGRLASYASLYKSGMIEKIDVSELTTRAFHEYIMSKDNKTEQNPS